MPMSVESYPRAAVERAMKVEEVLLRAIAGKITRWQAAEMMSPGCVPHERRGRWRPMRRHAFILAPAWRYPRYQEC